MSTALTLPRRSLLSRSPLPSGSPGFLPFSPSLVFFFPFSFYPLSLFSPFFLRFRFSFSALHSPFLSFYSRILLSSLLISPFSFSPWNYLFVSSLVSVLSHFRKTYHSSYFFYHFFTIRRSVCDVFSLLFQRLFPFSLVLCHLSYLLI